MPKMQIYVSREVKALFREMIQFFAMMADAVHAHNTKLGNIPLDYKLFFLPMQLKSNKTGTILKRHV